MHPSRRRDVLVGVAFIGGVLAPLLTRLLAEDTLPTAMLVALPARAWWVVGLGAAVVVALGARGLFRAAAVVPLLAVCALTFVGASFTDDAVRGPRVAAWNLAKGTLGSRAALVTGLRTLDADVICLSEAGRYDWLPDFDVDGIARDLGVVVVGSGEVRALVRPPITASTELPLLPGPARRPLVVVDVVKDARTWRVGCLHLMPRLFFVDDSVDRGDARTASWSGIARASRAQGRTLLATLNAAQQSGRPVDVVAGDWNHQAFGHVVGDVLDAGYVDVLAGADRPTFGRSLWAKRIDHLLVHATHAVRDAAVVDLPGSDHAAIVVETGPHRGR